MSRQSTHYRLTVDVHEPDDEFVERLSAISGAAAARAQIEAAQPTGQFIGLRTRPAQIGAAAAALVAVSVGGAWATGHITLPQTPPRIPAPADPSPRAPEEGVPAELPPGSAGTPSPFDPPLTTTDPGPTPRPTPRPNLSVPDATAQSDPTPGEDRSTTPDRPSPDLQPEGRPTQANTEPGTPQGPVRGQGKADQAPRGNGDEDRIPRGDTSGKDAQAPRGKGNRPAEDADHGGPATPIPLPVPDQGRTND